MKSQYCVKLPSATRACPHMLTSSESSGTGMRAGSFSTVRMTGLRAMVASVAWRELKTIDARAVFGIVRAGSLLAGDL